jgi:hypothetical protein
MAFPSLQQETNCQPRHIIPHSQEKEMIFDVEFMNYISLIKNPVKTAQLLRHDANQNLLCVTRERMKEVRD